MSGGMVPRLVGNQLAAVAPDETVWLSASAGTGKTQVLTSRVKRLLLQADVEPSQVLCLTFTKAGAAEMSRRIKDDFAEWVRLPETDLAARLEAIGADSGPLARARARTLFAKVLDCPGGGLRIDTIHAFSQWLLGAFPYEAGLAAGTRPMEERERALLARQVLAEVLIAAESEPLADPQLLEAAAQLSLRKGPDEVESFLLRCAGARELWLGPGSWQAGDIRANLLPLFGLPVDCGEAALAALCADPLFDVASLRQVAAVNAEWATKTGLAAADTIAAWLAAEPASRAKELDGLAAVFLTGKGEPRASTSQTKIDPAYPQYCESVVASLKAARELRSLLELVDWLVPTLRLGRAFAIAWDEAKAREGLIDFDDQIRSAADLLHNSQMADWIRYKLDRHFDHVLVDEAQDTNEAQWDIIFALVGEFWSGEGQRGDAMRTLFVVGDYKQAIFRFQGTSPEYFEKAKKRVRKLMEGAAENARALRSNRRVKEFRDRSLGQSFRTAANVLEFVDRAIEQLGHESFGLNEAPERHIGQKRPGYVALWRPVIAAKSSEDEVQEAEGEAAQGWLSPPDRVLADRIAQQVSDWVRPGGRGLWLEKQARAAGPGDVMILLRSRKELAALIVARLHAHGVPVAGVDRLRVGEPLAVRDLLAALRFAAQPLDCLNLANLLVSPLVGWSQEQLLEHGYREKGAALWEHLRAQAHPVLDQLGELLRRADFEPPQALLHWLLTGPWQGRRRLVARLGHEANDPIDELLNAAHAYTASGTPSLAGFLTWFDAGEGELKRDSDNAGGLVRVMTVHGSKGLQAPVVILADATSDPHKARPRGLAMPDRRGILRENEPARRLVPLPPLSKDERGGPIAQLYEAEAKAELEEHWRLLYVAMTRAEEALFVGGALGSKQPEPAPDSWFARLRALFGAEAWVEDDLWNARLEWGAMPRPAQPASDIPVALDAAAALPGWLNHAPAAEPRPPRPLAPSALGEDDAPDPPWPPGSSAEAAQRGTLIHKLLERLPALPVEERHSAGAAWLARNAEGLADGARDEMLASALAVIGNPDWAELFAPGSLAEVPVAATVAGQAIVGTIDRLAIEGSRVRLVDYKTARRPPASLEEVPRPVLRQMAAYAAALETVFPGRSIEAALLYTAAPRLIAIPADVLAAHKPGLAAVQ